MGKGEGIGRRHVSRKLEPLPVSPSLSPAAAAVSFADSGASSSAGTSPSLTPLPDARAPSNAWLHAHERHEAKKALDHAARIPVPTGMMDWTLRDNLWKEK